MGRPSGKGRRAWAAAASVAAVAAVASFVPAFDSYVRGGRAGAATEPLATATVEPDQAQAMQGFGASGAWWPNDLVNFPASVQTQVANQLFSSSGIWLSGYRYNIGGGGVGVTDPTHVAPTFLAADGSYDWSRDPGGITFLRLAAKHGVPELTGFVNSAPAAFTTNAMSCGGQLSPSAVSAYATYVAAVVRHLKIAEGITVSYVSPMNEPDSSFSKCRQEGMAVPVSERAEVVDAVAAALAQEAPWARVIADESSKAFYQFMVEAPQWLSAPGAAQSVAALAHHTYDYPTDAMASQVATVGARFGKPTWTTEICCYDGADFGSRFDPTMTSGIWLASSIWQDLTVTGDSAFYWWTALSKRVGCDPSLHPQCVAAKNPFGWNDGLLYYDPDYAADHNYAIYPTKRYYVLGNFSRYVRPGAVRHPVLGEPPGVHIAAFDRSRSWTVVAIDNQPATALDASLRLDLPTTTGNLVAAGAYRTSNTENLARVAEPVKEARDVFVAELPSQSVTTYVFNRPSGSGGVRETSARLRSAESRRGGGR